MSTQQDIPTRNFEGKQQKLALLIGLFEIPALVLVIHGMAYVFHIPGFEVVVNHLGGRQPIAFEFLRFFAFGGLLIPLALGYWVTLHNTDYSKQAGRRFLVIVGLSYLVSSVAWWCLIGIGVMMRFV